MSYRTSRLTYSQALDVISSFFTRAEKEIGLRPEQSYAYVLDEAELLQDFEQPAENIIVQTAIYKEVMSRKIAIHKDDPYTADMLEILSEAYNNFDEKIFTGLDMDEDEKRNLINDMDIVKKEFLS